MSKLIGMSRNINLEWLDETARLVTEGHDEKQIKILLNDFLSNTISSATNLRKTREILMNIWVRNQNSNMEIKKIALKLANSTKKNSRLLAHWCMILTSYSLFMDIVKVIGIMDDKQFDITTAQLKNRMFDVWGERTTLYHSIDKNIRTLKDMEVLESTKKGFYKVKKYDVNDEGANILIALTLLQIRAVSYLNLPELVESKEFYPFNIELALEELRDINIFNFDKFGDEIAISIK